MKKGIIALILVLTTIVGGGIGVVIGYGLVRWWDLDNMHRDSEELYVTENESAEQYANEISKHEKSKDIEIAEETEPITNGNNKNQQPPQIVSIKGPTVNKEKPTTYDIMIIAKAQQQSSNIKVELLSGGKIVSTVTVKSGDPVNFTKIASTNDGKYTIVITDLSNQLETRQVVNGFKKQEAKKEDKEPTPKPQPQPTKLEASKLQESINNGNVLDEPYQSQIAGNVKITINGHRSDIDDPLPDVKNKDRLNLIVERIRSKKWSSVTVTKVNYTEFGLVSSFAVTINYPKANTKTTGKPTTTKPTTTATQSGSNTKDSNPQKSQTQTTPQPSPTKTEPQQPTKTDIKDRKRTGYGVDVQEVDHGQSGTN